MVFAANYGGGSIAAYQTQDDGSLKPASTFVQHKGSSVNPDRQKGPHAHGVTPDPSGQFLYVPDLGLDQVLVYRIDAAAGTIAPATPPFAADHAGWLRPTAHRALPRRQARLRDHRDVLHDRRVRSRRVDAARCRRSRRSAPCRLARRSRRASAPRKCCCTRPASSFTARTAATTASSSTRVDATSGKLTLVQHVPTGGKTPRAFNIDPERHVPRRRQPGQRPGRVFRIDPATGKLTSTGQSVSVGKPVSFEFVR